MSETSTETDWHPRYTQQSGSPLPSSETYETPPALAPHPSLPKDGLRWRDQIERTRSAPTLKDIVANLWGRGIPVVPMEMLPTPSFQGIACIVEQRPVILLGYKHDEPGRVAYLVVHEAGHVASGHCAADQPVVDEEDEISDDADVERQADEYATQVLVGDSRVPQLPSSLRDFKDLARRASEIERANGADASAAVFEWARRTGDYATATMAVKALYRNTTPPSLQFPMLATRLVYGHLKGHFAGSGHCVGCSSIKEAADGVLGYGSAEVWRRLGTIHHISTVMQGLGSLLWP